MEAFLFGSNTQTHVSILRRHMEAEVPRYLCCPDNRVWSYPCGTYMTMYSIRPRRRLSIQLARSGAFQSPLAVYKNFYNILVGFTNKYVVRISLLRACNCVAPILNIISFEFIINWKFYKLYFLKYLSVCIKSSSGFWPQNNVRLKKTGFV